MSADNGIYILKTKAEQPVIESDFEYRVIHAQGIGNIYWDIEIGDYRKDAQFSPEITFQYFGEAPVLDSHDMAFAYAMDLEEDHTYSEYGICNLDHPDQVFQTFSNEEIKAFEQRGEELLEQHHEEREAERQAKLKAATIPFHCGERFEPGAIYGYLVREDGTKVHGSLSGIRLLEVVGTTETGDVTFEAILEGDGDSPHFLPSDWNKE